MTRMGFGRAAKPLAAAVVVAACGAAQGQVRIDFGVYENSGGSPTAGLDLWVQVEQVGSTVELTFFNDSSIDAFVSAIYFESTPVAAGLSDPRVLSGPGVNLVPGALPLIPAPGITAFNDPWSGNLFSLWAMTPGTDRSGIDPGESATVVFDLNGALVPDLLQGLRDRSWRIAQHVGGLPDGGSVWTVVPSPGTAALAVVGGAVLVLRRRRG